MLASHPYFDMHRNLLLWTYPDECWWFFHTPDIHLHRTQNSKKGAIPRFHVIICQYVGKQKVLNIDICTLSHSYVHNYIDMYTTIDFRIQSYACESFIYICIDSYTYEYIVYTLYRMYNICKKVSILNPEFDLSLLSVLRWCFEKAMEEYLARFLDS